MAATESEIWLHSLDVVIAAKYHNPSILNKDFLVRHRMVPESWKTVENIITPPVSVIKFSNGVQWMIDQDKLIITETCNRPFQQNEDSKVHERASMYVKMLPHTPYTALGLNCTVSVIRKDPDIWITQRFLNTAFHDQGLTMQPKFTINTGDAILNLTFGVGDMKRGNTSHKSAVVSCNVHYDIQSNSDTLKTKILGWNDSMDMVHSRLVTMLGEH